MLRFVVFYFIVQCGGTTTGPAGHTLCTGHDIRPDININCPDISVAAPTTCRTSLCNKVVTIHTGSDDTMYVFDNDMHCRNGDIGIWGVQEGIPPSGSVNVGFIREEPGRSEQRIHMGYGVYGGCESKGHDPIRFWEFEGRGLWISFGGRNWGTVLVEVQGGPLDGNGTSLMVVVSPPEPRRHIEVIGMSYNSLV